MPCKMRQRKDDIPKRSRKEKSWECETCGALAFSERKPICRLDMQGTLNALHAAAEADLHDIQTKGKP